MYGEPASRGPLKHQALSALFLTDRISRVGFMRHSGAYADACFRTALVSVVPWPGSHVRHVLASIRRIWTDVGAEKPSFKSEQAPPADMALSRRGSRLRYGGALLPGRMHSSK